MSRLPAWLSRLLRRAAGLSGLERALVSVAAVVAALVLGGFVVLGSGYIASCREPTLFLFGTSFCFDPVEVYAAMYQGAFGTQLNQALTLQRMTLLVFTGLAFAIPYRAGLFNIGAQGQFVLAALGTTVTLLWLGPLVSGGGLLATAVLVPAGLVAGALAGGLYGLLPGVLKARYGTNEVISTLLLNFIATAVAIVLVKRFFNDPGIQGTVSRSIPEAAVLRPWLFPTGARFSVAVLAATLALVVGFWWLLNRTTLGYDIRVLGRQRAAAVFGGVDAARTTVLSMTIAGAVAGLGGALYVMMVVGRWQTGIPALGFDGIAVSVLAGNNPLALVPSGVLFGALQSGGLAINFQLGIPRDLVEVLRGLVILLVATPELFRIAGRYLRRRGRLRPAGGEAG
ncbi:ABC transporter permease [Salinirussus salinus]|jgi:simple sugar transport system permease protein|uniref:ABC transporter permease n=1 Tax=Salinirussus salinus TaxID=1198300 RepID=UPI0013578612|nr:ABC transporter permease [Salinirussus salinus]